ncbi:hypothetical protein EKO04_006066 [Ascochyta lentis]|uniref:Uncharacterized protein n=1 Tax=Ascochyta lentis TaxID=205686 RepID=A0A8H7MI43_9PLEO|nr:hypothetical protein EKO04_006066 [Ascochyta lentis]
MSSSSSGSCGNLFTDVKTEDLNASHAALRARIDTAVSQIHPIANRLEQVKQQLDRTIDLGIQDIQYQEDFSHITSIGEVETPESIDDFVNSFHNIHTIAQMKATLTVQAIHSALQTAKTMSSLTAKSITALKAIARYKQPYNTEDKTWATFAALQGFASELFYSLTTANESYVKAAIEQYDPGIEAYKDKDAVLNEEVVRKFKEKSDEKRRKQLRKMWEGITNGSAASRDFWVQKRKIEGLLHVLRWPWIEALEDEVQLLRGIQKDLQHLTLGEDAEGLSG